MDIVNIGIGGSDLGLAMAVRALAPFVAGHLRLHTVANVDGADHGDTLKLVPLETTLFVVCSKTFATNETMTNTATARNAWAPLIHPRRSDWLRAPRLPPLPLPPQRRPW